ncbi:MAG: arylsulfatase [Planctomycetota bacterium]|jgi:arylsulfatase
MKTLIVVSSLLAMLFTGCVEEEPDTTVASAPAAIPDSRPNILLIIGDDMGFSDVGAFGSEVATPNVDALAREGLSFTNFHVGATCSPTRSLLLTGVDNHRSGLGNMHEFLVDEQRGQPGYEGYLNKDVVTIIQLIRDAGYSTYMSGKWHLGADEGYRPHDRGFDQTYTLLQGAGSNYGSTSAGEGEGGDLIFTSNGTIVKRPEGIHSNELYADKLIDFLNPEQNTDKPFFAYLSFQTAHWPHQAPREFIDKYRDVYSAGWDLIRERRIEKLKSLGIVSQDLPVSPRFPGVPAWDALPAAAKVAQANTMAAYGGMIDHMDVHIGRVIDHLKNTGQYDNTIIIYMTDNGPDWSQPNVGGGEPWYNTYYPKTAVEDIGLRGSFSSYGPPWAQVAAAHLSGFKTFSTEGGLRVPFIIRYPEWIEAGQTDEFVYVTDLSATLLEVAGATHPGTSYKGRKVFPMNAKSVLPLMRGESSTHRGADDWLGYELFGNSAIFHGDYKALRLGAWLQSTGVEGAGEWQLYDLKKDPSELHDLAEREPDRLAEMVAKYAEYSASVGVIDVGADFNPVSVIAGGK